MKFLYQTLFIGVFGLFLASCNSDECPDTPCPTGFECVNGQCVTIDPCDDVTCDAGFSCVAGDCIADGNPDPVEVIGTISSNTTWSADRFYIIENKVVVESGVTLTIEPGTIVKGKIGAETLASALVIARGGKLIANGTAEKPIIFTSELDNIELGSKFGTNLTHLDNEKWGGIIILGNAPISAKDGDTEANIEGIPPTDSFGKYGGDNATDNSGSLKYVSIRHGGVTIGEGNEINGLTLGGVGSGTVLENIEVAANLDDGVEFFGGTVNASNVIVSWQGDDAIDIDMNYSGTVENFAIFHGGSDTDEALEIDGPEGTTYTSGLFTLRSGTCVALDTDNTAAADIKSNAQGNLNKIVWRGYNSTVKVRASFNADCSDKLDTWTNVNNGELLLAMCEWVSTSASIEDFARVYVDGDDQVQVDCFEASGEATAKEMIVDNMVAQSSTIVTSATEGADLSVFEGWTWASNEGLLNQ